MADLDEAALDAIAAGMAGGVKPSFHTIDRLIAAARERDDLRERVAVCAGTIDRIAAERDAAARRVSEPDRERDEAVGLLRAIAKGHYVLDDEGRWVALADAPGVQLAPLREVDPEAAALLARLGARR